MSGTHPGVPGGTLGGAWGAAAGWRGWPGCLDIRGVEACCPAASVSARVGATARLATRPRLGDQRREWEQSV